MRLAPACLHHYWHAKGCYLPPPPPAPPPVPESEEQKQRAQVILAQLPAYYEAQIDAEVQIAAATTAPPSAAVLPADAAAQQLSVLAVPLEDLRATLYLEGYAVAKGCGQSSDLKRLEENLYTSASHYEPDGAITIRATEDTRQLQSIRRPVLDELCQQTTCDLQQHNLMGNRDKIEMKAIISEPSAGQSSTTEQELHCDDADPSHEVYSRYYLADDMMLAGVRAIMPGTKIVLYPKGKDGPRTELELQVGETVVFRGDCFHCGAKYSDRNVRLHFYLSSPKRRREKNETHPA